MNAPALELETPLPVTEQAARVWLTSTPGPRPSIRTLAAAWGWSKSKVERFLARIDAETASETSAGTAAVSHPDASDKAAQGATRHDKADEGTTRQETPETTDFDWRAASDADSVIVPPSEGIALYWNPFGAVVIRQQASWDGDDDRFVYIEPKHLPAVMQRLQQMLRDA